MLLVRSRYNAKKIGNLAAAAIAFSIWTDVSNVFFTAAMQAASRDPFGNTNGVGVVAVTGSQLEWALDKLWDTDAQRHGLPRVQEVFQPLPKQGILGNLPHCCMRWPWRWPRRYRATLHEGFCLHVEMDRVENGSRAVKAILKGV
jgi:hypothetical protein